MIKPKRQQPEPSKSAPNYFPPDLAKWFAWHVTEFNLAGSELDLLRQMGDVLMEYDRLRLELAKADSYTFTDRHGVPRERPELHALTRCRTTFSRLRRELALPVESEPEEFRAPRISERRA